MLTKKYLIWKIKYFLSIYTYIRDIFSKDKFRSEDLYILAFFIRGIETKTTLKFDPM